MSQQELQVSCTYFEDGDVVQILRRSFSLYLDRALGEDTNKPYHRQDEWSPASGGRLCTWK